MTAPLRQIIYESQATQDLDEDAILEASRHNNALDGVTGVLLVKGRRIVQVLEGPEESVSATFARISRDAQHDQIRVLSVRVIAEREFGYWSMEHAARLKDEPEVRAGLKRRLEALPAELRAIFASDDL